MRVRLGVKIMGRGPLVVRVISVFPGWDWYGRVLRRGDLLVRRRRARRAIICRMVLTRDLLFNGYEDGVTWPWWWPHVLAVLGMTACHQCASFAARAKRCFNSTVV